MDSESQDATKIASALADSRIHSFMKMLPLYMCLVSVVTMSTSRPTGVCRINRWTKHSAEHAECIENYYYESLAFSGHRVDLAFNEEGMKPERFTEAPDHAGF